MTKSIFAAVLLLFTSSISISQGAHQLEAIFQFDAPANVVLGAEDTGLQSVKHGMSQEQIDALYEITEGRVNFKNIYRLKLEDPSVVEQLEGVQGYTGTTDSNVPPPGFFSSLAGRIDADPELQGEWWIKDINAEGIWSEATGQGVIIADCDAGYFWDARDLKANMLYEHRYDFSDNDAPLVIDDGGFASHGTSVSAIMSGVHDNMGTNGIAFESKVVPLQNYNYSSNDDMNKEEATALCVLGAMKIPGVQIIVLENQTATGSSETYVGTRNAVRLAIEAGFHVISAAGNYSKQLGIEAEDDTGSVIVGALGRDGSTANFSNYGDRITIAAFGTDLKTLVSRDGKMGMFGGTSGATPQVAAAVALMLEIQPKLTPAQVRSILESTRVEENKSTRVGGRLDVAAAVEMAHRTAVDIYARAKAKEIRRSFLATMTQ